MKRLLAALVLVAVTAAPALADPKSDVLAAFVKFGAYKSYHATVTSRGKTADIDLAPPSKMHMKAAQGEMIKIEQTVWVKAGGAWRQFAIPGMDQMVAGFLAPVAVTKGRPEDFTVTDLGTKSPDGAPLHAYTVVNKAMKEPATVYIDAGGNIARIDAADGSMRISQPNAVDIEPPM